jgi:hypothetical protein
MKKVFPTPNGKFYVTHLRGTGSTFEINDESSQDNNSRDGMALCDKIGYAIGTACIAKDKEEAFNRLGHFLSTPVFFACRPFETSMKADYCHPDKKSNKKIFISESFAIEGEPSWFVDFRASHPICFVKLASDLFDVIAEREGRLPAVLGFTGVSAFPEESVDAPGNEKLFSVGICIHEDQLKLESGDPGIMDHFISFRNKGQVNFMVHSLFSEEIRDLPTQDEFLALLRQMPGKKKLQDRFYFGEELMIDRARLWVFRPGLNDTPAF